MRKNIFKLQVFEAGKLEITCYEKKNRLKKLQKCYHPAQSDP